MGLMKKLFITDWLIIFYILFVLCWVLIGRNSIIENGNDPYKIFLQYASILAGIIFVILLWHLTKSPIMQIVRFWYPCLLLGFFFSSATLMDRVIFKVEQDEFFQIIDYMIFGYQPAVVWGTENNTFLIQELFHFAYFTYYPILFFIPLYIYIQKNKAEYIRVLFNLLFVFVACYVFYMFLPVVGGRYIEGVKELTTQYRHGIFTHTMVYIYNSATHWGGAFPSSHVAVMLTLVLLSFRYFRSISLLLVINFIFLSISTVFCHYHYFADVVGGVLYGFMMFVLSEFIYMLIGIKNRKYIDL